MQIPRPHWTSSSPHSRAGSDGESASASRARWYMSHRSSPPRSRTPSRSKRSASRPPSRRSSSRHSSRHSCRRVPSLQEKGHSRGKLIKDSAGLLLGIGVAAVVAHKFWPKGMLYGAKEDWETRLDKAAAKVKHKARDKVLGDDNGHDDPDVRCSRHYPPRRCERGRSMTRDRAYYESETLAGERGPAPPLPRSRSCRERVPTRGRSLGPARTRVYQEAVDNTATWERLEPRHHQQGRGEPSYASGRYYYQRQVDSGRQLHCHDDFIVVEEDVPRHGGRDYI